MSYNALRVVRSIDRIRVEEWPSNRERPGTFRKLMAAEAEEQPRKTICGFCGKSSTLLDGPSGRAWFHAHRCKKTHLRLVASE